MKTPEPKVAKPVAPPKPEFKEHELRATALKIAVDNKKFKDEKAEDTVAVAETFLGFLKTTPPVV